MSPYNEHPAFKSPSDVNCRIWRYIDFPKFVSLLAKESLFFVRGTILAEKYDKFEGKYPPFFIKKLLDVAKDEEEKNFIKNRFNQYREFGDIMGIN